MSFGFGGAMAQGGGGQSGADTELQEVQTEQLSFQRISGEDTLRLLPSPWPSEQPPPPSASLLSIASTKGLVAAAGPDALVVAKTDSVREQYKSAQAGDANVKTFAPEATIPMPARISQVCFSSDESCLVLAAEQGGGLAVYETDAITSGSKESAFQISTNGASVRQLLPNPNPANDLAHFFALVLETGQLLLANLKTRELVKTSSGSPVFHENVTCASWSRLGKQIVAGRKDGTAVQIDPQGNVKAEIPVPPRLGEYADSRAQAQPMMSIYWIETNDFLLVHTPINPPLPPGVEPGFDDPTSSSIFHLASRDKPASTNWTFRRVVDPTPPAVMPPPGRTPAHHFIQRLKDWPPSLDDTIFLLSTISTDVGMLAKSKTPLDPQNAVTGVFTTTGPLDSGRAGLPMSVADGMSETSAIGMAVDLSVKERIRKPIPMDEEISDSPVPLPALFVLNHEGLLSIWYVVYNDSVRQSVPFPDLIAAGGPRPLDQKKDGTTPTVPSLASPQTPGFGAVSTPQPAASTPAPLFGAPSTPGFGSSSALGSKPSLWGAPSGGAAAPATSTAPKPTFGSATAIGGGGAGFGQVGGMGMNKPSVWGAPQQSPSQPSAPAFGKPSTPSAFRSAPAFGKPSTPSAFGGNASAQSPFAAFGKKDGDQKTPATPVFGSGQQLSSFGGLAAQNQQSPWAAKPSVSGEPSFGSTATLGSSASFGGGSTIDGRSVFGTPSQNGTSSFGKPSLPTTSREETMEDDETPTKPAEQKAEAPANPFAGFKLGSTFKGDGSAKDDLPKPKDAGAGFFGGGFGKALGDVQQPSTPIKQEPGTETGPKMDEIPPAASTTPAEPPRQMPKRVAGDVPPSDVPGEMPKRVAGDVPPFDVPAEKQPKQEDPTEYKAKRFAGDVPPSDIPGDVPPTTTKAKDNEVPALPLGESLAGSSPVDVGATRSSETGGSQEEELPPGPEDEDEEDWEEEDEGVGEDDEEEGEDDEEEEDEEDEESGEITDPKALSAFEARLTPASAKRAEPSQEESTTPATEKKPTFTPAGFPKPLFQFAPPSKSQESPRSPSPIRSVTAPLSKPRFGQPSQPPPSQTPARFGQPSQPSPSQTSAVTKQPQRIAVPPARLVESTPAPVQPPAAPTEGELQDQEDAQIQAVLNSKPEPTTELPDFLAHQDYVNGENEKPGIGGQIERVYRDINSMIDTLGLNARALMAFVDGHTEFKKRDGRGVDDLDDEDSWVLDEAGELDDIQQSIEESLDAGKLTDVRATLEALRDEDKETGRLRMKTSEIGKQIKAQTDPEHVTARQAAPLPVETQAQQSELRQSVQRVQKLLGQVEEAMSLLRADLSSAASAASRSNGTAKVPTVEAVTNTILKMTAMIEEKSGDIDVLEREIRRLPKGGAELKLNGDYEDQLVESLAGSKLLNSSPYTPSGPRTRMLANGDAPGMAGMFGSRYRTPPSKSDGRRSVMFSPEASRLGMSTGSFGGSARKKMVDVTAEEVDAYHAKVGRRRKVLDALRDGVESKGARVVTIGE